MQRLSGDPSGALESETRALEKVQEGPRADRERMRVLAELGLDHLERAEYEQAGPTLDRALELSRRLQKADTPERADVLVGLGRLYLAENDATRALASLSAADAFWTAFDPESRWAGEASLWRARAESALGRHAEAKVSRARAQRILRASPLPGDRALLAER